MKNIGFSIGIAALLLGTCMLVFGNGFGIILLMLGSLGAIVNK
jgi:hypothetical protein